MNDLKNNPIKRSPYLAPLSREHHEGLLLAWKIKQGVRKGVELTRITAYCNWFFKEHLAPHFHTEEKVFSQVLSPEHPLLLQMLAEHRSIEKVLQELAKKTMHSQVQLLDFGTSIELHIRFEERFFFNHIESVLSPEQLSQLQIAQHQTPEEWPDPFWL